MSTRKNASEEALAKESFLNLNATKPSLFIVQRKRQVGSFNRCIHTVNSKW